ncbi:hypothetical protein Tco_0507490 [Tanacetum coccineum]
MDLYHSRLTPDDLNDLIIKYKILRDLHPWLPLEDFVMFELLNDAIGPLSLNKTLCKQGDWFSFAKRRAPSPVCIDDNRSCMKHWKSGFFFIDRRAILDSLVWRHPNAYINDPRPAIGSFNIADVRRLSAHVIKLRDMPEGVLVLSGLSPIWKSHVCDSVLGGADRNVMGIHDFLCLPEWTGVEVQEEPHLDVRPTLQRLPFYYTPPAAADVVIPDPTLKDLSVGTPSSKIDAKAEASQKRKASTSCATSSHVAKRTRSALAQSSGSTMFPSLFVGDDDESDDDDDDDACVEILLVTPLRSADVIPSLGNQGGSSITPAAEGSNTRDSRGKGVMVDDDVAPSTGVSRPRLSSGPAPSFRDVSGDAIHTDFFPFSAGPYYATYLEDGVAGNCFKDPVVCKTIVDQFPTPGEMVWVESLSDDQLTAKMSVLHCMMTSHGGELLTRYRGLNRSHHEYVLLADSRLKGYEEKSKAKGKERKKKIKSLTKSMDNLHAEVACLFADLNRATGLVQKFLASDEFSRVQGELLSLAASDRLVEASSLVAQTDYAFLNKIFEHATEPLSVILQLEPEKLTRPTNVPTSRDARVSLPIAKESIVTPASESLELSTNVALAPSAVTLEQNKEWVNAMVDGPNVEMTDGAAHSKSGGFFVQGTSHALDDVAEVTMVGSERVSSGPNDVVVALFPVRKGRGARYAKEHLLLQAWGKLNVDVLLSIQRILSHATRPKPHGFPLGSVVQLVKPLFLVFLLSLVGIRSLYDVVVHQSLLPERRRSLCLLLRPYAKVFMF